MTSGALLHDSTTSAVFFQATWAAVETTDDALQHLQQPNLRATWLRLRTWSLFTGSYDQAEHATVSHFFVERLALSNSALPMVLEEFKYIVYTFIWRLNFFRLTRTMYCGWTVGLTQMSMKERQTHRKDQKRERCPTAFQLYPFSRFPFAPFVCNWQHAQIWKGNWFEVSKSLFCAKGTAEVSTFGGKAILLGSFLTLASSDIKGENVVGLQLDDKQTCNI